MVFGKDSHQEVANIPPVLSDLHCFTETDGVVTTTMNDLPGYRVEQVLGTVYGITVRSRNLGASLAMVLRSLAGGELRWFTSMLYACRNDAIGRVVEECKRRGGNAVVALRFETGDAGGFAQCSAYGTACRVVKVDERVEDAPQLLRTEDEDGQKLDRFPNCGEMQGWGLSSEADG